VWGTSHRRARAERGIRDDWPPWERFPTGAQEAGVGGGRVGNGLKWRVVEARDERSGNRGTGGTGAPEGGTDSAGAPAAGQGRGLEQKTETGRVHRSAAFLAISPCFPLVLSSCLSPGCLASPGLLASSALRFFRERGAIPVKGASAERAGPGRFGATGRDSRMRAIRQPHRTGAHERRVAAHFAHCFSALANADGRRMGTRVLGR
jgi:hypothetical protein